MTGGRWFLLSITPRWSVRGNVWLLQRGGQVLGRRPLAVKEKKIPAAAAAAAAAAADGVRAPSSAEKQNIKTHEMAKEHVLKKNNNIKTCTPV